MQLTQSDHNSVKVLYEANKFCQGGMHFGWMDGSFGGMG